MEVSQVSVAIGVVRAARATRNRFVLAFRFIGSVNSFASPLCAAPMPFSLVGTASLPPREAENVVFGTQVAGEMASFSPFFRQFLPTAFRIRASFTGNSPRPGCEFGAPYERLSAR